MPRFLSWLAVGLAAAFLVVASASFAQSTVRPLAFAISIGTLVVTAGIAYAYRRDVASVVIASLAAVVSAWTIVASQVFSVSTVQSLALASSLAISALAVIGLTAHELTVERVVHTLEDGSAERGSSLAAAA